MTFSFIINDRNVIEKHPERYQGTYWFSGAKTLKDFPFMLRGAIEASWKRLRPLKTPAGLTTHSSG
jgi:hypothetical protein